MVRPYSFAAPGAAIQSNIPHWNLQQIIPKKIWLRTGANDCTHAAFLFYYLIQDAKRIGFIRCNRSTLLDFNGIKDAILRNNQVNIDLGLIFLSVLLRFLFIASSVIGNTVTIINPPIGIRFQNLGYGKRLNHCAAHSTIGQGFGGEPSGKIYGEPSITKIYFWGFNRLFQYRGRKRL